MGNLAWLNELMLWLGKWVPRLMLIQAGNIGVWFGRNGRVRELAPGLYCYWPITTNVTVVSTRVRTTEIAAQLLGTEAIAVVTAFRVACPKVMMLAFNDVFSQLDDRIQAHLGRAYRQETTNEAICSQVVDGLRGEFESRGVEILSVDVMQRGWCLPLKNINDWANHSKSEL